MPFLTLKVKPFCDESVEKSGGAGSWTAGRMKKRESAGCFYFIQFHIK